jgi:hypothetical protein
MRRFQIYTVAVTVTAALSVAGWMASASAADMAVTKPTAAAAATPLPPVKPVAVRAPSKPIGVVRPSSLVRVVSVYTQKTSWVYPIIHGVGF